MDPVPHTLAASSAVQAAPRVRVYADRKGRRCGLIVGMAIFVAAALFLFAAFMVYGLTFQAIRALAEPKSYIVQGPLLDRIGNWVGPSLGLLTSTFLGMWLISAARTYARYVCTTGEVHQLALMLAEHRKPEARASKGHANG